MHGRCPARRGSEEALGRPHELYLPGLRRRALHRGASGPGRQNNSYDTIQYVNSDYLTRSTQVALATLAVLANGLQPPDNFSLRANPQDPTNHTLVWSPVDGAAGYIIALRPVEAITYTQILNVGPTNSLTWSGFTPDRFEGVSIAAVDDSGRWGPFSAEFLLASAQ
jgi:hypothetical protein